MSENCVLGVGEVGTAISKLYNGNVSLKDPFKKLNDNISNCSVVNVCFPFKSYDSFLNILLHYLVECPHVKLIIVHSTVVPGTTSRLRKYLTSVGRKCAIVHSPIRGVHPELYESIITFEKMVGYESDEEKELSQKHLENLGLSVNMVKPSRTSEVAKILSTTQYGIQLAAAQEMKYICDHFDVDYNIAINDFNRSYNIGYEAMNKGYYKRSLLKPMSEFPDNEFNDDVPLIGGHCVSENLELLLPIFGNTMKSLDLVKKFSKFQNTE